MTVALKQLSGLSIYVCVCVCAWRIKRPGGVFLLICGVSRLSRFAPASQPPLPAPPSRRLPIALGVCHRLHGVSLKVS